MSVLLKMVPLCRVSWPVPCTHIILADLSHGVILRKAVR